MRVQATTVHIGTRALSPLDHQAVLALPPGRGVPQFAFLFCLLLLLLVSRLPCSAIVISDDPSKLI